MTMRTTWTTDVRPESLESRVSHAHGGRPGSRWLRQALRDTVTSGLARPALLAHDGEVREVSGEISFRTRPGALRVVVPAPGVRGRAARGGAIPSAVERP